MEKEKFKNPEFPEGNPEEEKEGEGEGENEGRGGRVRGGGGEREKKAKGILIPDARCTGGIRQNRRDKGIAAIASTPPAPAQLLFSW